MTLWRAWSFDPRIPAQENKNSNFTAKTSPSWLHWWIAEIWKIDKNLKWKRKHLLTAFLQQSFKFLYGRILKEFTAYGSNPSRFPIPMILWGMPRHHKPIIKSSGDFHSLSSIIDKNLWNSWILMAKHQKWLFYHRSDC